MELIDRIKKDIDDRLEELRPQIEEIPRLEAALAAIGATGNADPSSGARRGGPQRRARRGQRREELLQLLKGAPEISVAEAARQMGVSAPQVSTLLRRLREEGVVERADGRFVVVEETTFSGADSAEDIPPHSGGAEDESADEGPSAPEPAAAGIDGPGVEALAAPEGGDEVTDAPEAARDEAGRPQAT
jgi:DNA-binding transcriptional ArsR family regulator